MLQLKYNLDSDRVAYIPNGVERDFLFHENIATGDALRLLYAGTWLDQRGIFYIREHWRNLTARLPGLTMTFAGSVFHRKRSTVFWSRLASRIIVRPVSRLSACKNSMRA